MRRVVVTGMGIVSCIGNNQSDVLESLKEQRSGITFMPEYKELGLRSHVAGRPNIDLDAQVDRKLRRFMGDSSIYAYVSLKEAIEQAGLSAEHISHPRTGMVVGSGGCCSSEIIDSHRVLNEKGVRRVGPYRVTKTMGSSVVANLATAFSIKGVNYGITSACATGAHCIGHARELIQWGKQDIVFAGGAEEEHWSLTMQFDAMGALSTDFNYSPEKASRPYDRNRDGFVIAGGSAMLVLEDYEHAVARGANIIAEIVGYSATSDGVDMVAPSGEGAQRCIEQALEDAGLHTVDYINTHGTSTPAGDFTELNAIRGAIEKHTPLISSTKSLTGHSLGAAGAQEAVYCLLMLKNQFVAASSNIEELDDGADGVEIVTTPKDQMLSTVMSNSFGFGGTNGCLIFKAL